MLLDTPQLYEQAADKVYESTEKFPSAASENYERAFALYRQSDANVSKIVRRFLMNERVSNAELRARALKFIQVRILRSCSKFRSDLVFGSTR